MSAPPDESVAAVWSGDEAPGAASQDPLSMPDAARYRPGALLGAGGMGRVLAVFDRRLEREVARKEALAGAGPAGARRLAREARITAGLDHPGIVPVHDAGADAAGRPWYTMPVLRGRTLAELLVGATSGDRPALLRRVLAAAEAVAYAHSRGVVHRDIKPANILLGPFGETRVADWGLATTPDDPGRRGAGTPAWMSPEQLRGEPATARSDVWSLGATLLSACCGALPWPSWSGDAVLAARRASGASWRPGPALRLPPELEAIIGRAMAPDPADRYPDAGGLVEDLEAYIDGRRVGAHDYRGIELLRRLWRLGRAPILVALCAAAALIVAVGIGWSRTADQRRRAEHHLAEALTQQARAAEELGDRVRAEQLAAQVLSIEPSPDARGVFVRFAGEPRPRLRSWAELPPSCDRPAAVTEDWVVCAGPSGLRAFAGVEGEALWSRQFAPMTSLTTASDGGLFASSPGEGLVEIDPRDGATVRRFPGVEAAERVIRSRDGRHLAAWQASRFALFDVDLGQVVTRRGCGAARVDAAAFGGGGLLLLCSDHHGVWLDPESSSPAPAPIDLPGALAVGPGDAASLGGGRFVLGSLDGWLRVLDAPAWDVLEAVRVSEHAIVDVEVSPDRRRVVARGEQGEATIWLVGSADLWRLPTGDLRRVSWRDDLRLLGDRAERWSIPPASAPRLQRVGAGVSSLRSSPAGRSIVAGLGDGRVVVWGLDGAAFREVSAFRGVVKDAHLMEDGSRVVAAASVDEGSTLRTVDLTDGRVHEGAIRGGIRRFAILADGSALGLSYGPSGPWSARSVGSRATALGWSDEVLGALAVDGAGRRVAVTTESGLVIGGTLGPRGVERRWTARIEGVGPIALGPSGRVLAVTRSGPRLLEDGGAEGPPLDPISLQPTRAAFSPAGDRVAVGDLSGSVWIWRVEDGRLLARLRAHGARISGLVFSGPEELVSASWDASIRRWDLGPLGATTDELIRGLGEAG